MEKIIFIIKNYEDETKIEKMQVKNYWDIGAYYKLEFEDGCGTIIKDRVIRIEEVR